MSDAENKKGVRIWVAGTVFLIAVAVIITVYFSLPRKQVPTQVPSGPTTLPLSTATTTATSASTNEALNLQLRIATLQARIDDLSKRQQMVVGVAGTNNTPPGDTKIVFKSNNGPITFNIH